MLIGRGMGDTVGGNAALLDIVGGSSVSTAMNCPGDFGCPGNNGLNDLLSGEYETSATISSLLPAIGSPTDLWDQFTSWVTNNQTTATWACIAVVVFAFLSEGRR